MPTVLVIDALEPEAEQSLEVTADTGLDELRALILSLDLPSSRAALAGARLVVCHDGCVLERDTETLVELGIFSAPAVVVLALSPQPEVLVGANSAPPDAFAPRPAVAAASAGASLRTIVATAEAARATGAAAPPVATGDAAAAGPARTGECASEAPDGASQPPADALCRICFSGAYENGSGRLISPCLCMGSMRYVHVACLNEWRTASSNPRSFYQCEQCLYRYSMQRTKYAELLEDPRLVRAFAGVLLVLAVLVFSLLLGMLGVEQYFYRLVDFYPAAVMYSGQLVSRHWGPMLDRLIAGMLGVAFVGLGMSVHDAWRMNRHMNHGWLIGILATLAAEGGRGVRLFTAIGLLHSMRSSVIFVEHLAKTLLTQWGTMILEVNQR